MNYLTFFLTFCLGLSVYAQTVSGTWSGDLNIQSITLKLVFHFTDSAGTLQGSMDSPDQGAYGIPLSSVSYENETLEVKQDNIGMSYTGTWMTDSIKGTFRQNGMEIPLTLIPGEKIRNRPQEPKPPFPYLSEEVTFNNEMEGHTLAGTLTLPESGKPDKAVVLVSGSGPQNRDEELMGHKPFLVLADHLTQQGIAVLRYDDRGTGQSTGDFQSATSFELTNDVLSALRFLNSHTGIDDIGIIGHSEGGLIAPMAANQSDLVDFIVLMAGPGVRGDSILMMQSNLIAESAGISKEILDTSAKIRRKVLNTVIEQGDDVEKLEAEIKAIIRQGLEENEALIAELGEDMNIDEAVELQAQQFISPWMIRFIGYDPYPELTKVTCPVLAINGTLDLQVPFEENLTAIENALKEGGNNTYKIEAMEGLNHLFQEAETGSPTEYSQIEQTMSPQVLEIISQWIKGL